MLTKCVFLRFSSPGKAFSKFYARYKTLYETSIISSSRALETDTKRETVSALISYVFLSYSHILSATYRAPTA